MLMRFKAMPFYGTPDLAHCRARNDSRVKGIDARGMGNLVDRNPSVVIHWNSDRPGPFPMPAK
jgi:hypothetical protein